MTFEIVVVGGGIGGLTAAALLAARGLSVCLLEKESRGGGCAAAFEKFGYSFEPGASLYASWQPGEIHERIFAELPSNAPPVKRVSPAYVVRLPDRTEVCIRGDAAEFEEHLRAAFPECAAAALKFYRELAPIADALQRAAQRRPALATLTKLQLMKLVASEPRLAPRILGAREQTAAEHLRQTSLRFRRFIDAQLQIFAQTPSDSCSYLYAAVALMQPLRGLYTIRGGGSALAGALVESIRRSGGTVRFDTTVLRLFRDAHGRAAGVELLSGERIEATRGVVSNLTMWDTYGKLVGLNQTPAEARARLKHLRGWGAYLVYLGMDEEAVSRLPANNILVLDDWQEAAPFDPEDTQLMFSLAHASDSRAPAGKRAVTVSTFTEAEKWFSFHEDETEHEEQDQAALENLWTRLHAALPELGASVEVIETDTPRTFYERTRRKLGMVGGIAQTPDMFGANALTHRTAIPNLFMVGDTVFPGQGIAAVTQSALIVANEIAPPT